MKHLLRRIAFLFLLLSTATTINAQIGIGTASPDPSAALHVQDTARGLLTPRMTAAQRIAIVSPAEGLLVYQTDGAKGFWYFTTGQWTSLVPASSIGKSKLVLSGSITNAEAVIKIAAEAGPFTQEIDIIGCSNLTTVDLSVLTSLTDVYIMDNPVLQTVNFSNVKEMTGGMYLTNNTTFTNLNFASLQRIGSNVQGFYNPAYDWHFINYGILSYREGITQLNFPQLKEIAGNWIVLEDSALTTINCPQLVRMNGFDTWNFDTRLTSISMPALVSCGNLSTSANLTTFNISSLTTANGLNVPALSANPFPALINVKGAITIGTNLTSLSLPSLQHCGMLYFPGSSTLTSISFPALTSLDGIPYPAYNTSVIKTSPNLTSITLSSLTSFTNDGFDASGNKLSTTEVNNLLVKFASLGVTGKTFDFTQTIPAPPSGAGITAKNTLISQGNTVVTD